MAPKPPSYQQGFKLESISNFWELIVGGNFNGLATPPEEGLVRLHMMYGGGHKSERKVKQILAQRYCGSDRARYYSMFDRSSTFSRVDD